MMLNKKEHPMVAVADAIRTVLRETARCVLSQPIAGTSMSPDASWEALLNLVLDEDATMPDPGYPPYNASIMDGYAIQTTDKIGDIQQWTHKVVDRVYAGSGHRPLQDSDQLEQTSGDTTPLACYITTGAVVPDYCDCVVPIENCKVSADGTMIAVKSPASLRPQQHIRGVGCDIPTGSVVLPKGQTIDSICLGLLKQSGVEYVSVKSKIKVGVLSTGNELIESQKQATRIGQIPDVNRPILLSLISTFKNCAPIDLGMGRDDDAEVLAKIIDEALCRCDIVITTGGVSMGETDIVEKVLVDHCGGTVHFGRMHMKPGKPTTFVTVPHQGRTKLVFAMPGNPVSGIVCTHLLVKPCVNLLSQPTTASPSTQNSEDKEVLNAMIENAIVHPEIPGVLMHDVTLDVERPEYRRVTVDSLTDGNFHVSSTGVQRSSRLMSMCNIDGLLVLPQATENKKKALAGEAYPLLLITDYGDRGAVKAVQVRKSQHMNPESSSTKVKHRIAVVQVSSPPPPPPPTSEDQSDQISGQIERGLSGSKSGSCAILPSSKFDGSIDDVYDFAVSTGGAEHADFIVVVVRTGTPGSLPQQLDACSVFRKKLSKLSDAMAQQVRQGAASADPLAAMYEVVVGYAPGKSGALTVCLSDKGLESGLGNVRGLLKHALNVARGKPHSAHH